MNRSRYVSITTVAQEPIYIFNEHGDYLGVQLTWRRDSFVHKSWSNHYHEPPRGMQEMVDRIVMH